MGNLPPFPMLSHQAITTMVQTEAGLSIVGLGVSLLALGYDHIMYVTTHTGLDFARMGEPNAWVRHRTHSTTLLLH